MNKIRCIITICLAAMTMAASAQTATSNHNFEVAKNLDIFNALYRDLDLYYVDTLDAAKNIDNAANYMLEMPRTIPPTCASSPQASMWA